MVATPSRTRFSGEPCAIENVSELSQSKRRKLRDRRVAIRQAFVSQQLLRRSLGKGLTVGAHENVMSELAESCTNNKRLDDFQSILKTLERIESRLAGIETHL